MNISFSGKVALVAGGTGGLGAAVSLAFLEQGAQVVVTYRREQEFAALKNAAEGNSDALEGHRVDVTDELAVSELVAAILAHGLPQGQAQAIGFVARVLLIHR